MKSMRLLAIFSVLTAATVAHAQQDIFGERFDDLTIGPLAGQKYWTSPAPGDVVAFGDGNSLARTATTTGSSINDRSVFINPGTNTTATFSIDVRKSISGGAAFALGGLVDTGTSSLGLVLGLSTTKLVFREGLTTGTVINLTDVTGVEIVTSTNTWYRVKAEINVTTSTISSVTLQNLTAGTAAEQVYFGSGVATRTLPSAVANWNQARIRVATSATATQTWVDDMVLTVPNAVAVSSYEWSSATVLHPGILHARVNLTSPRTLAINVLRVDLRHPDIRLAHNPRGQNWVQDVAEAPVYTTRRYITTQRAAGINMVAAINGGAFDYNSGDSEGTAVDVKGLTMDRGAFVSPARTTNPALIYDRAWEARIESTAPEIDTTNILTAVSGFGIVLSSGGPMGTTTGTDPRTGLGLSENGRYLFMLTIDGRQSGYSDGATQREVGIFLRYFGAFDGLNMDGGGSTTLAYFKPSSNSVQLLNTPSDRFFSSVIERRLASNLGVYFVDAPEPISFAHWLTYRGVAPNDQGVLADPNRDGISNLLSYAFNIHPLRGAGDADSLGSPTISLVEEAGISYLEYKFRINRHAIGLTAMPKYSDSLMQGSWTSPVDLDVRQLEVDPATGDLLYRARLPMNNRSRAFLRLETFLHY